MRTTFFFAISTGVLLASCGKVINNKNNISCPYDTISKSAAYRMIHHYADSLVAKGPSDIIRNFKITNNCLANIIASSDETTFWTAADTVNHKALIIAQVKAAGAPSQFYMLKGIP